MMASFMDRGGLTFNDGASKLTPDGRPRRFLGLIDPRLLTHTVATLLTQTLLPPFYLHPKPGLHLQAKLLPLL